MEQINKKCKKAELYHVKKQNNLLSNKFIFNKCSNNGITLIALVVTIVVLLILAGVTITMVLGKDGIIAQAKLAAEKTKEAEEQQEKDLANLVNEINDALGEGPSADRTGINIGDYINYEPTGEDTYTKTEEECPGASGSINRDPNMKWQVLKIYSDGSMDIIGTPTEDTFYLDCAGGYNNGVYVLNDICRTLYSRKSDGIEARSINIEDFERAETEIGKTAREKYISDEVAKFEADGPYIQSIDKEKNTVTYTHDHSYYPNLYAKENGSGIDTETTKTDGLKVSDKGTIDTATGNDALKQATNLTTTFTYYKLQIDETNYGNASKILNNETYGNDDGYWLASRCVICFTTSYAWFYLQNAWNGTVHCSPMYNSSDETDGYSMSIRPVVHLGTNVQITPSDSASTEDGTPHTITQYK